MNNQKNSKEVSEVTTNKHLEEKQSKERKLWLKKLILWLSEKDNGQEASFLVKAISSGNNLIRALIILTLIFLFLRQIALEIIDCFVVQVDEITFSGEGNPIIRIKGKQSLQVISVPAYQRWISPGITLSNSAKVQIRATGSVATGLAIPRYLERELYKQFSNELGWRLSRLEFNEDVYLGWREADGKLLQGYDSNKSEDNIYGSKCIDEKSRQKKLVPELGYGVLLAFLANNNDKSADKVLTSKDKNKFFMVGKQAEIEFLPKTNLYRVTYVDEKGDNQIRDIPAKNWEGDTLYFTINDSVVQKKEEFKMFSECLSQEKQAPQHLKRYMQHQEERYAKIYEKLSYSESIWFMDNRGDFTVTIITKQN
ncbi:hypothetical protein F7734_36005 [Scytonema sp. UIC 10036]|uniref:hypothetical protein n=1 Tax=Scytonema sp. UIC 10036 TaxID=2304196 RepID=UPI0012DAA095|nr:hypothetical protein [Scytonema sp. UIC 10036]MUG97442.1 hypothetical protein [Scytonema sp. UIC 10036]